MCAQLITNRHNSDVAIDFPTPSSELKGSLWRKTRGKYNKWYQTNHLPETDKTDKRRGISVKKLKLWVITMFKDFLRGKCQQIRSRGAETPDQEPVSFYLLVQNSHTEAAVGSCIAIRARINQYLPVYMTQWKGFLSHKPWSIKVVKINIYIYKVIGDGKERKTLAWLLCCRQHRTSDQCQRGAVYVASWKIKMREYIWRTRPRFLYYVKTLLTAGLLKSARPWRLFKSSRTKLRLPDSPLICLLLPDWPRFSGDVKGFAAHFRDNQWEMSRRTRSSWWCCQTTVNIPALQANVNQRAAVDRYESRQLKSHLQFWLKNRHPVWTQSPQTFSYPHSFSLLQRITVAYWTGVSNLLE